MAYDADLVDRIRAALAGEHDVSERRMFGGLAFFINGNMAVCATSKGQLMVRVDPAHAPALLGRQAAQPMVMRGRELAGWLVLPPK